jgi:hypothetical protein
MLRKISIAVIAVAVSGFSMAACATTIGIGYTNIGIHAGDGLNMSLPGGSLTAKQSLGSLSTSLNLYLKFHRFS